MTGLIGMLGRDAGFKGKQRLDWVVAWAAERKELNVFHYSSYIAQLTEQNGRLRVAKAAFEQMQAAGVTPDDYTYSSLISAYDKGGQWQAAEGALKQMQAAGLTPDVVTFNSLISAYDKGGRWQAAEGALKQMQAAGVTPNVYTYNSLISACDTGGQWRNADSRRPSSPSPLIHTGDQSSRFTPHRPTRLPCIPSLAMPLLRTWAGRGHSRERLLLTCTHTHTQLPPTLP